jgi:signal transduction histidine kinase
MSSRKTAKVAFASAVVLLLLCGVAAMVAISRYSNSAQWVEHTYEVKVATGSVESTLSEAARDRLSYITGGDPSYLLRYESARKEVSEDLLRVRELTLDNPQQQDKFNRLDNLANQRIALLQTSLDARAAGQPDAILQTSVSLQNTKLATDVAAEIAEMQNQEDVLLASRKNESSMLFAAVLWIFGAMLACAVALLWVHYRFLNDELNKREEAENGARRLSVHVLELQDEERRKFSRELHDGLGQNLAVAKMIAFSVLEKHPDEETVPELIELLNRSIQETRTISYLLHPPLLDELGIASAANWYLDGFSQRSGVQITAKIADEIGRLPRPVELVLFRVLQESLTNVNRHAKSAKADVSLYVADGSAVLQVRDYGIGIPSEKLHHFRSKGTHVGVGLTGMRERVHEHGGKFEIRSSETGTELLVTLPLGADRHWEREIAEASRTT